MAERMHEESEALAADWLARLDNLLSVDVGAIFPTSEVLDHVPLLIRHIADYVRAPEEREIAANTLVIEKAQELGHLRHRQQASVHQLLREYAILAEILERFLAAESAEMHAAASPLDGIGIMQRLGHAIRALMQTTVDTFIGEYTTTIERQRERLQSFNRMVTHEMRTPLGALRFAAALLDREDVLADRAGYARITGLIQRNVARTADLVRSLEHLAFAERPVDAPSRQRVSVAAIATEAARQLADMAQARDVELRVDPALPEIVTEAAQLELVLVNLLSNAIKYCDTHKPRRYAEVVSPAAQDAGACTLCVRDNGIGIPPEMLQDVFTRFFRAHRERDQELGADGFGLGLSITQEAVQILGGQLRLESKEHEGTAVYITLPDLPIPESSS